VTKKKKWIFLIIGVVVLAAVAGLITYSALSEKPVIVNTQKVEKKTVVQTVQASGKIEPVQKVEISAYVSAEIVDLPVKEGQVVKKGDLLCVLDSTRYRAGRDQILAARNAAASQAQLALANLDQAQRTYDRTIQLAKQDLVSHEEMELTETKLDVAKAAYDSAKNQVEQSAANLRVAGDDLEKTVLRSPLDGIIISLPKENGEIVMGSTFTRDTIMTVADMSTLQTVVEVDENDVRDVRLGQESEISVDAFPKEKFHGIVTEIANSAKVKGIGTQEETTSFDVTITLTGDVSQIRPGMSSTAHITTATHEDVLAVPLQCLTMRDPDADPKKPISMVRADKLKEVVYKVADKRARMMPVKTGVSSEFDMEIEGDGVQEGLEIVCGPYKTLNKELKEKDLLKVTEETAAEATKK